MPSLYTCLEGLLPRYFDTITTMLMIALLRSHHAPDDNTPRIPVGYRAHATEVLKHYPPDNNQAIQCTVSCQTMCQMKLELGHLAMLETVVGTSTDLGRQCLSQNNASPLRLFGLRHRFNR
jgi:hypothetical protein